MVLNRGERYDWFESNFIKFFAAMTVLGLTLFIWRSFTAERPLVDLRVFKNRDSPRDAPHLPRRPACMAPSSSSALRAEHAGVHGHVGGAHPFSGGFASLLAMVIVGQLVGERWTFAFSCWWAS